MQRSVRWPPRLACMQRAMRRRGCLAAAAAPAAGSAMRDACMAAGAAAPGGWPTCVQRSPPCVAGLGAPSAAAPVPRGGEASSRDPLATRRSAKGAPRASDELLCALHLVELMRSTYRALTSHMPLCRSGEGKTYRGASWVAPSRPKVSWSRRACVAARPVSQEGPRAAPSQDDS